MVRDALVLQRAGGALERAVLLLGAAWWTPIEIRNLAPAPCRFSGEYGLVVVRTVSAD